MSPVEYFGTAGSNYSGTAGENVPNTVTVGVVHINEHGYDTNNKINTKNCSFRMDLFD